MGVRLYERADFERAVELVADGAIRSRSLIRGDRRGLRQRQPRGAGSAVEKDVTGAGPSFEAGAPARPSGESSARGSCLRCFRSAGQADRQSHHADLPIRTRSSLMHHEAILGAL